MYFNEIEIENYKCFRQPTKLKLKPGINIVVGQNNVGKTALLEALSLYFSRVLHQSLETFLKENRPPRGSSKVTITFTLDKEELFDFLNASHSGTDRKFSLPLDKKDRWDITLKTNSVDELAESLELEKAKVFANNFFSSDTFTFKLLKEVKGGENSSYWHILNDTYQNPYFERAESNNGRTQNYLEFYLDSDTRNYDFFELRKVTTSSDNKEDFSQFAASELRKHVYRFRAERVPSIACELGQNDKLDPTANNLAEVLSLLQGHLSKFKELNDLVHQVLPNVYQIGVRSFEKDSKKFGQVVVWNAEKSANHRHLAQDLNDVGSGVGQVIALLYVILTSQEPQVILIDEPQSFLHPNAARKLIEIIHKVGGHHQLVITTHSPTIITAAPPSTVTLIKQKESESELVNIEIESFNHLQEILEELGGRFSDVFGFDRVIWVEGQTEEKCFPKIISKFHSLLGTAILRVQNTGDFEKVKNQDLVERIISMYVRLSNTNNGMIPTTTDFIFDKELRSDEKLNQLKKFGFNVQKRQCVHFLTKRMYENYLLNAEAITAVINEIDKSSIGVMEITEWINTNKYLPIYWDNRPPEKNEDWKNTINAAKFLEDIFASKIKTEGIEFTKTMHSIKLTEWILENSPEDLRDINELLEKIIHKKTKLE